MTRPGVEPRSPWLMVNTPRFGQYIYIYIYIGEWCDHRIPKAGVDKLQCSQITCVPMHLSKWPEMTNLKLSTTMGIYQTIPNNIETIHNEINVLRIRGHSPLQRYARVSHISEKGSVLGMALNFSDNLCIHTWRHLLLMNTPTQKNSLRIE